MSDKIRNEYTFGKDGSKTICTYCFFWQKEGCTGNLGAPYKIEILFLGFNDKQKQPINLLTMIFDFENPETTCRKGPCTRKSTLVTKVIKNSFLDMCDTVSKKIQVNITSGKLQTDYVAPRIRLVIEDDQDNESVFLPLSGEKQKSDIALLKQKQKEEIQALKEKSLAAIQREKAIAADLKAKAAQEKEKMALQKAQEKAKAAHEKELAALQKAKAAQEKAKAAQEKEKEKAKAAQEKEKEKAKKDAQKYADKVMKEQEKHHKAMMREMIKANKATERAILKAAKDAAKEAAKKKSTVKKGKK